MSLTPRSRLSSDSHRSPIGAAMAAARPIEERVAERVERGDADAAEQDDRDHERADHAADQALDGLVRAGLGERRVPALRPTDERPDVVGDGGDHRGEQEADAVGTAQHQRGERAEPADPRRSPSRVTPTLSSTRASPSAPTRCHPRAAMTVERDQERVGVGPLPVDGERRQQDGDVAEQGGRLEPGAADRVEELEGADREDGDDQGHRDRRAEHERGHAEDGEAHAPDDRGLRGRGRRPRRAGRSRRRRWRTRPPGCGGAPGGGGDRRRRAPRPRPPRTTRARTRCSGRGRSRSAGPLPRRRARRRSTSRRGSDGSRPWRRPASRSRRWRTPRGPTRRPSRGRCRASGVSWTRTTTRRRGRRPRSTSASGTSPVGGIAPVGQLDGPGARASGSSAVGRVGHGEQVVGRPLVRSISSGGAPRRSGAGSSSVRSVVVLDAGGRVLVGGDGRLVLVARRRGRDRAAGRSAGRPGHRAR